MPQRFFNQMPLQGMSEILGIPFLRNAAEMQDAVIGDLAAPKSQLDHAKRLLEKVAIAICARNPEIAEKIIWCVCEKAPKNECQSIQTIIFVAAVPGAQLTTDEVNQLIHCAQSMFTGMTTSGEKTVAVQNELSPSLFERSGKMQILRTPNAEQLDPEILLGLRTLKDNKNNVVLQIGGQAYLYRPPALPHGEPIFLGEEEFVGTIDTMDFPTRKISLHIRERKQKLSRIEGNKCDLNLDIATYQQMHQFFKPQTRCHFVLLCSGDNKSSTKRYQMKSYKSVDCDNTDLFSVNVK